MRMRSTTITVGWLLLAGTSACGTPSEPDDAEMPSPHESICVEAPACASGPLAEASLAGGWVEGGGAQDMKIFLSSPATTCGNETPRGCTECGIYESVTITLPPEAQVPGIYTEAEIQLSCANWVADCMGNAGAEGEEPESFTIEIESIDGGCVTGEIIDTNYCTANPGPFAVSRCG